MSDRLLPLLAALALLLCCAGARDSAVLTLNATAEAGEVWLAAVSTA